MFVWHHSKRFIPQNAIDTSAPIGIDCAPESLVSITDLAWVNTKDRLPTIAGDYLTTRIDTRSGKPFLCISRFYPDPGYFMEIYSYEVRDDYGELVDWDEDTINITNEILAWMPWPKLYSEEV